MSRIRNYYMGTEVQELFGWATRTTVTKTAKREKWKFVMFGTSKLYRIKDVERYSLARKRTQLAQKVNWLGVSNRLVRDKSFDMKCPICKEFAIGEKAEKSDKEWICVNGHASGTVVPQEDNNNKIELSYGLS